MPVFRVLLEVEVNAKTPRAALRKVINDGFGGAGGRVTIDIPQFAEVQGSGQRETIDVHDAVKDMGVL